MGLLEQQYANGLLARDPLGAATSNRNMLAQALKARQTTPRNALTGQGLLDTAAIGLSPVPVIGDVLGLAADANRFVNEPESRTPLNFGLAALGLIPFVPPLVSAGLGKFAQSQGKQLAQMHTGPARNQAGAIVYHGSPHKFDAFDSSKIGTGEGAQAYGHGLYFAENPTVAKGYAEDLTNMRVQAAQSQLNKYGGSVDDAISASRQEIERLKSLNLTPETGSAKRDSLISGQEEKLAELMAYKNQGSMNKGSLYKVDLPDEAIAKMLDWDKPLSQQAPEVQKAIAKSRAKLPPNAKDDLGGDWSILYGKDNTGADLLGNLASIGGRKDYAESLLSQLGIPGVRYLDGGSRGAGQGTSNYVVFPGNEGLLKILERQ